MSLLPRPFRKKRIIEAYRLQNSHSSSPARANAYNSKKKNKFTPLPPM
jgi:hypothetical protein